MGKTSKKQLWLKICGITHAEDLKIIASVGAQAIGLVFVESSKRFVSTETASGISHHAQSLGLKVVGVFANHTQEKIESTFKNTHLDLIQLHGDESPAFCRSIQDSLKIPVIKALAVTDKRIMSYYSDYEDCHAILLDNKDPGSGKRFDWNLVEGSLPLSPPTILAGGLTSENLKKIPFIDRLYGIDLSSSVESSPGRKSAKLVKDFKESLERLT
jgi:phosphoribosylanthranilate isomerase